MDECVRASNMLVLCILALCSPRNLGICITGLEPTVAHSANFTMWCSPAKKEKKKGGGVQLARQWYTVEPATMSKEWISLWLRTAVSVHDNSWRLLLHCLLLPFCTAGWAVSQQRENGSQQELVMQAVWILLMACWPLKYNSRSNYVFSWHKTGTTMFLEWHFNSACQPKFAFSVPLNNAWQVNPRNWAVDMKWGANLRNSSGHMASEKVCTSSMILRNVSYAIDRQYVFNEQLIDLQAATFSSRRLSMFQSKHHSLCVYRVQSTQRLLGGFQHKLHIWWGIA